jgi:flagellar protein FliO/FliZ
VDFLSFLRMMGSLAVVLGLLVGALWLVRRYEIRVPQRWLAGFSMRSDTRRMELIERLAIDPRRSVALIRLDNREHMVLITPEGVLALDSAAAAPQASAAPLGTKSATPADPASPQEEPRDA